MASKPPISPLQSNRVRLVVASTVMLTFISFWRAAAIVLNDLGSSAFYAAGIAEEAVGKSAPWFNKWVAKACRNVCGESSFSTPAFLE